MGFIDTVAKLKIGAARQRNEEEEELTAEEEIARNLWANFKMFPPKSKFKRRWDQLIVGLVMYNTVFILILVCFNRYNPKTGVYWYEGATGSTVIVPMVIDYLVDLFFVADIFIVFRTTYYNAENEMVIEKKVIRNNYLRNAFTLDVVSVLPFEFLGFLMANHALDPRFRLFRLLRVAKIFKQINVHNAVVRVSQLLWVFLMFTHAVGAFWWAIGVADFNRKDAPYAPSGSSWVTRWYLDGCLDAVNARLTDANFTESSIAGTVCADSNLGVQYVSSFYWSLTTLIKTAVVHPDTIVEAVYASIFVIFGAIAFAAILGNITAMINSFDKSNAQLRDIMTTLHRLIDRYHSEDPRLRHRVFQYVQVTWSINKGIDNRVILSKLPPALRGDILEAIHTDLVQQCVLLKAKKVSTECVRVVLSKLRSEVVMQKDQLLKPGQLCAELFILLRGTLSITADESGSKAKGSKMKKFKTLETTGKFVGFRDPWEREWRFPFSVQAIKQSQVAVIGAKDLLEAFTMENRADADYMSEVLEKEYNEISKSLKADDGSARSSCKGRLGSVSGEAAGPMRRSSSDLIKSSQEELHTRVAMIEENLRSAKQEINDISKDLALLPAICEKLGLHDFDFGEGGEGTMDSRPGSALPP